MQLPKTQYEAIMKRCERLQREKAHLDREIALLDSTLKKTVPESTLVGGYKRPEWKRMREQEELNIAKRAKEEAVVGLIKFLNENYLPNALFQPSENLIWSVEGDPRWKEDNKEAGPGNSLVKMSVDIEPNKDMSDNSSSEPEKTADDSEDSKPAAREPRDVYCVK